MPVSDEYLEYVKDQLQVVGTITAKKMFGGAGLYLESVFFALIANDVLYFKVDETNQPDYEAEGMNPFRPYGKESYAMSYYEVPIDILEDEEQLRGWAERAYEVAVRKQTSKKKRKAKG